jgi:AraC family transcriptional regulator of adaptative response/methylated-DNA-[protein]-cysteine methyltransferase
VQTTEGEAIDNLVSNWEQAKMTEDHRSTASLVEPIFDLGDRGKPLSVHLRGTNFQLKVWEALLQIPAGAVTTYEGIASQIGKPSAMRAVGTAIGHNPIAVLIPCHRVIRKVGEFGNYRYGALRKKAILAREFSAAHA